jgi:HlyD family secretion protein
MTPGTRKTLKGTLVLVTLGACGVQIARSATSDPVTSPRPADVTKASRHAVSRTAPQETLAGTRYVGGNGVVEPADREARLATQVTAVVRKVLVQEGELVQEGALLVQLDDAAERASLRSAEAELAAERATLAIRERGVRAEDRDALAAEARASMARAGLSDDVMARAERLVASGAQTAAELERARLVARADRASAEAAQARLRAAEAGTTAEEIAFQRARVAAAEARVAQARAAVTRLTVRAPRAGEVLQVKVREGELHSAMGTEPLVVLGDTRQLRVRMDLDERDIARVQVGALAYVTADAFGDRRFQGRVVEMGRRFGRKNIRTDNPVERNDTKILEVVLQLDDDRGLVPGQRVTCFVEASVPLETPLARRVTVPALPG